MAPTPTFSSNDRPRNRTDSFAAESSSRGRRPRTASNAVPPPVIPPDVYGTAPAPARSRPRSNSVTAAFRRIIGS
ncbi:hypothetical protein [Cedecea davisae]|uniref:hypothetical protein n=1 Tax=Cedecea davisae TaxID=158484 RepID=UPI00242EABF6|nr:hypothetical protein [Cedecea davisae]